MRSLGGGGGGGMNGRTDGWMNVFKLIVLYPPELASSSNPVLAAVRFSLLRQMYDDVLYISGR